MEPTMADRTMLFSICVKPWRKGYCEDIYRLNAKYANECEIVTGWSRRSAARKACGLYLVFPKGELAYGWDRAALDAMARCNEPMQIDEESRPMLELRLGKSRIATKARVLRPRFWERWYRKLIPKRVVVIDA
jgi:hypothetical protein